MDTPKSIPMGLEGTMFPKLIHEFNEKRKQNTCPSCHRYPVYKKGKWEQRHTEDCPKVVLDDFFGFRTS